MMACLCVVRLTAGHWQPKGAFSVDTFGLINEEAIRHENICFVKNVNVDKKFSEYLNHFQVAGNIYITND